MPAVTALFLSGVTLLGMSAPSNEWDARLAETGPVYVQRLFSSNSSVDSVLPEAREAIAEGRLPVLSIKPGTWSSVANGSADAVMQANATKLDALEGDVVIVAHHEPVGDSGLPADWARMQVRILPMLAAGDNVYSATIFNGHPFRTGGYSDAQIGAYMTPGVIAVADFLAGDFYHAGTISSPGEGPAVRMTRFADWAARQGVPATRLGVGEMGAHSDVALRAALQVAYGRGYAWVSFFNNEVAVGRQLTPSQLVVFREYLAVTAQQIEDATDPPPPPPPVTFESHLADARAALVVLRAFPSDTAALDALDAALDGMEALR